MLTDRQRELARHALGFPNARNQSYRNHFCVPAGCDDHAEWEKMVTAGYAVKRSPSDLTGGDDLFHMTIKGALLARNTEEHLSPEDSATMRYLEDQPKC